MKSSTTVQLLDPRALLAGEDFDAASAFVNTPKHRQIGWHYIVDLAWIHGQVRSWPRGIRVLDVGGGTGPAQFMLAEMGFHVTNIDLVSPRLPGWMRRRYAARRATSVTFMETEYAAHLRGQMEHWRSWDILRDSAIQNQMRDLVSGFVTQRHYDGWRMRRAIRLPVGSIKFLRANACNVADILTGTFDAVVSLSAIEHIPPESLPMAIAEIERLLKPAGRIAITTSATERPETWMHLPSRGLCFSMSDAERLFQARNVSELTASEALRLYRQNEYLRRSLAAFYFKSGDNGMPNGIWDPAYVPIGISG